MKLSPSIFALSAMAVAAPVAALAQSSEGTVASATAGTSIEQQLASCIQDRDPALLEAIRDAASEEAFVAAFRRAVELCEFPEQEYSLGRFFDAVNALLSEPKGEQ